MEIIVLVDQFKTASDRLFSPTGVSFLMCGLDRPSTESLLLQLLDDEDMPFVFWSRFLPNRRQRRKTSRRRRRGASPSRQGEDGSEEEDHLRTTPGTSLMLVCHWTERVLKDEAPAVYSTLRQGGGKKNPHFSMCSKCRYSSKK